MSDHVKRIHENQIIPSPTEMKKKYMQIYCVLRISRAWFTCTVYATCDVSKYIDDKTSIAYKFFYYDLHVPASVIESKQYARDLAKIFIFYVHWLNVNQIYYNEGN